MKTEGNGAMSGARPKLVQVLLVEARGERDGIKNFLEANGCVVRVALTAHDALDALEVRAPEVLITDVALDEGRLARLLADRLQRDARTRHVARIALTNTKEERAENVVGFDAYLARPVEVLLLLDLVRNLTYGSRDSANSFARATKR